MKTQETKTTQRTPGPWEVSEAYDTVSNILAPDGFPVVEVKDTAILERWDERIPDLRHWSDAPGKAYIERDPAEVEANARFIVRAVNCHDALVAALKVALDVIDSRATEYGNERNKIVEALAAANER